ncbi:MAG: hypothetical protein K6U14_03065 [Firmicutes bacterium]|nr:hypothetical protein [Alicyclobacillaceae bacterium]MCL6496601.1 hypothetical protein [Bacillota bacterium]
MQTIHDNKPPISSGTASLFVDLIFWHPQERDLRPLVVLLEEFHLGERSQTVEWLNKFTLRLSMWRGKYWYFLSEDEWKQAAQDLIGFIRKVAEVYRPKSIEYDTRAFAVGLRKAVRREVHELEQLVQAPPAHDHPVWWVLKP